MDEHDLLRAVDRAYRRANERLAGDLETLRFRSTVLGLTVGGGIGFMAGLLVGWFA